jgi:hypothetical protein
MLSLDPRDLEARLTLNFIGNDRELCCCRSYRLECEGYYPDNSFIVEFVYRRGVVLVEDESESRVSSRNHCVDWREATIVAKFCSPFHRC